MKDYKVCFADGNEKLYGAESLIALVEFLNEVLGEYANTITKIEEKVEKMYRVWYSTPDYPDEDYVDIKADDERTARYKGTAWGSVRSVELLK